jgi:predicted GNAT family acetyltransferase
MLHALDRPIWTALTTRQTEFAEGNAKHALRFAADVEPFVAAHDNDPDSIHALAKLIRPDEQVYMIQAGKHVLPYGVKVDQAATLVQMVAESLNDPKLDAPMEPLTDADAPEMLALATLTKPGPFKTQTHKLGSFWGIKQNGKLVAMAGERMKAPGYTELSGVCTHPDARGKGYAKALSAKVMRQILSRGDKPFLHAYDTNTEAIKLYEGLGFAIRAALNMTLFRLVDPKTICEFA